MLYMSELHQVYFDDITTLPDQLGWMSVMEKTLILKIAQNQDFGRNTSTILDL